MNILMITKTVRAKCCQCAFMRVLIVMTLMIGPKMVAVWVQDSSATPVSWLSQERRSCTWPFTNA